METLTLDFTIELSCPATDEKVTQTFPYQSVDELLWVWIEGNFSCDCCRSILLWNGSKSLSCNSDNNQIEAYLIEGNRRILLDDIDRVIAELEAV